MANELTLLGRIEQLEAALQGFVDLLNVDYNTNLIHLEFDGVPAFRPIEQSMRDKLGTLFTLLFNARALLASAKATSERAGEPQGVHPDTVRMDALAKWMDDNKYHKCLGIFWDSEDGYFLATVEHGNGVLTLDPEDTPTHDLRSAIDAALLRPAPPTGGSNA